MVRSSIFYLLFSICAALLAGLCTSVGMAQPVRRIETGFERDTNRFRWTSHAHVELRVAGWDLALTNRFLSDAFILFEDQLRFRDEDQVDWQARRVLRSGLEARVFGQTAWYGLSRVLSQEVYGGLRLAPRPYAWVEPALGAAMDQRPGVASPGTRASLRMDAGPAFGIRMGLAPPPLQDYRLRLHGEGRWHVITPRQGRSIRLEGTGARAFENTQLAAALRLANVRRDTYQAVSFLNRDTATTRSPESIEATASDTLEAMLSLDAPFYRGMRLNGRLDIAANNRYSRTNRAPEQALFFETNFNRRAFDAEAALTYDQPQFMARATLLVGAATERRALANRDAVPPTEAVQKTNLLQQADYDEGTFGLTGALRATLHPRLVLAANGSSRIVRHDTPEANPDDRDEVYHNGEVGLLLRLSRYVEADVKLSGSFYHTVYINAERSAENNVQRSLRLRPSLRWTPSPRTRVRLGSEVRATYTVDDFVLQGRSLSDQSAREMRVDGSLEQDLPGGLRLMADGSFSDLRLGRLLWNEFAEIPFDTLRTYNAWVHIQTGQRLVADIGFRVFIRTDYERAATVRYVRLDENGNEMLDEMGQPLFTTITRPGRQWIEQVGPTAAITWPMARGSALRLDGWVNIQHIRRRLYGLLPDATADHIRHTARSGTRTLLPNVRMTAVWNF